MSEPVLNIQDLRYRYRPDGERVLAGVDLRVEAGEHLLLCGASGSGKSTLCRTFNGLIPHFHGGEMTGRVRVAGRDTATSTVGGLVDAAGIVFQNPQVQLFNRTVALELAYGLESLGLRRTEIRRRMAEAAEAFGIAGLLDRPPHALSGGEQHLVCLAAAAAMGPALLVLDEPFANLDPSNVGRVRESLKTIRRAGIAVVVSEHRLALAAPDAGRAAVIHGGRLVLDAPPRDVLTHDLAPFGLDVPPAAATGLSRGVSPLPLTVEELSRSRMVGISGRHPPPPPVEPSPGSDPVLEVDGLCFAAGGRTILDRVDLAVHRGECLAVVGANGAGKTTLLRHFNGLLRPARGTLRLKGGDTAGCKVSQLARKVGIAFQNPASQFFKLTVREELEVGPRTLGCLDPEWIGELVDLFGLQRLMDRPPYRLSDGQKKRVAFAAALAARPAVLALDEPTAGQDAHFRRALGRLLAAMRRRGQAVVIVTHDLAFAEANAHRWVVLAGGRVLAEGRPDEIMSQTGTMNSAGLLPTDGFRLRNLQSRR